MNLVVEKIEVLELILTEGSVTGWRNKNNKDILAYMSILDLEKGNLEQDVWKFENFKIEIHE